jgi:predicted metalloprotease
MNRNQKIALGCGGGGCLGLILLVIAVVVLIVTGVIKAPGLYSPNSNSNYNYNSNRNTNTNSNTNTNNNLNSNSNSDSSSSMSDDDKHKLFQAAGITKDNALILRVIRKIGFGSGTGSDYQDFIKAHFPWAMKNLAFIQSVNTPETARAYVDEHIND